MEEVEKDLGLMILESACLFWNWILVVRQALGVFHPVAGLAAQEAARSRQRYFRKHYSQPMLWETSVTF